MDSTPFNKSSLEMTRGGANLIISSCVGLARTPSSFINKQRSQAVLPLAFVESMTIALNKPRPLTSLIIPLDSACNFLSSSLRKAPNSSALSTNFSSLTTSKAAMATLEANGLPPWDNNTSFTLDWFQQDGTDLVTSVVQGFFNIFNDTVSDEFVLGTWDQRTNVLQERTKLVGGVWVSGHGNNTQGSTVEVVGSS
ncbi:hypothetical protein WICPIJ_005410 [Wickerhamomyces pijperi]|uniref:Uncharacterized protein n=1 Tax=Wickerhamomyces pijperi TaxID=599730 RepID=A0A9P8TL57_WICPI|nr:hypothetical protein WICPIJ_005410 [Wickerhamomyces pijperi]